MAKIANPFMTLGSAVCCWCIPQLARYGRTVWWVREDLLVRRSYAEPVNDNGTLYGIN